MVLAHGLRISLNWSEVVLLRMSLTEVLCPVDCNAVVSEPIDVERDSVSFFDGHVEYVVFRADDDETRKM